MTYSFVVIRRELTPVLGVYARADFSASPRPPRGGTRREVATRVRRGADDARMGDAAVETVTILITDLVGSTQLESRVGPIVAEELRQEHFELLRRVVDEAGGREVKNTGDGLMVAFDGAAAAVSCAVS